MDVFHVGKRRGKYVHWEPIFIGTHQDPYYDERLSWEGKKDKMTQVTWKPWYNVEFVNVCQQSAFTLRYQELFVLFSAIQCHEKINWNEL